jgi:hypothetical protein
MSIFRPRTLIPCLLLSAACASDPVDTVDGHELGAKKGDQISGNDDPSGILGDAERSLSKLVTSADVGKTFGMDDDKVPYPDTYWPMVDDGIAARWNDEDVASPLEKFMELMGADEEDTQAALAWETQHHGKGVPGVQDWFGHCPGWTAAATSNPPIRSANWFRRSGLGKVTKCADGADGCTKFEIGDMNGLMAEAYEGSNSSFIGGRCDTKPDEIERDADGRIIQGGCQGLNAGAMVIVATNMLKLDEEPFAIDAQNEFNTDQIWNQPAFRYTVHRFEKVTEAEAANLVAHGTKDGDRDAYEWNDNARGFAMVDFAIHWVSETGGPNTEMVSGLETENQTRMVAVVELDRPADEADAQIIGGEYVDDEDVGANRLRNHPFVWKARGMGRDSGHNPFVQGAIVAQMIDQATDE